MSLTEKVDELKGKAKAGIQKGKKAFQKGKTEVYKAAATVGQKIEKREGVIGEIANVVEDVVEAGKQAHSDIQAQGGYKKVFGDAAKGGLDALQNGVDKGLGVLKEKGSSLYDKGSELYAKGNDLYERLKREVESGEGAMDLEKVKAFLKDGARVTAHFGVKAVKGLTEIVNKGVKDLKEDYRTVIPTAEERSTRYAGIGTDYQGVLLRKNFEECLAFYAYAQKRTNMPNRVKHRTEILSFIKASASSNAKELSNYCEKKWYDARRQFGEKSPEAKKQYAVWNQAAKYLWLPTISPKK
jgi:hypothetical protein